MTRISSASNASIRMPSRTYSLNGGPSIPVPRNSHEACDVLIGRRTKMADDKTKLGQADRSRINMSEDYEVRYWTKHLGVTQDELKRAVDKVGNSAPAVRRELGKDAA